MELWIHPLENWLTAPLNLTLSKADVHIWRASLNQPKPVFDRLLRTLNREERTRFQRFRFQEDRAHFIVRRGILREVLGRYLKTSPQDVQFSYSHFGKPTLAAFHGNQSLDFSSSSASGLFLCAFTRERRIGIDLECVRPIQGMEAIARHFFSAGENEALERAPVNLRTEAFFNCWTRKEAFLKANGVGLIHDLDSFEVSVFPGEAPKILSINCDYQTGLPWSLISFAPAPDYLASICLGGHDFEFRLFQWLM